jgi:hypothetical protein
MSTTIIDSDPLRGASHRNAFAHLSGPFTGGAIDVPLALDANGRSETVFDAREPLVVVAPRQPLGADALVVQVAIGSAAPVVLTFAPYSDAGGFVPAGRPPIDAVTRRAAPFAVTVSAVAPAPAAPLAALVDVAVVEGVLGGLLFVMQAEKARIRRQARELFAARQVALATGDALDRLGAELAVPRFTDRLIWDATLAQPTTVTAPEPDDEYRRRLAIYRPFFVASRRRVARLLNGPGDDTPSPAPPTGLLSRLGVKNRVTLAESDTELAVAIKLVSPPDDSRRLVYLKYLRDVYLLPATATDLPPHRLVSNGERIRTRALLARLAAGVVLPANAFLAPQLAEALDRLARARAALGLTPLKVLRAQDDAGGSRYELGLGADLEMPIAADVDRMVKNLAQRKFTGTVDAETQALLDSLTSSPVSTDPAGRWLLLACGLHTVHELPGSRLFVSHFPMFGMTLDAAPDGNVLSLAARFHAPGDPGPNVIVAAALAEADKARTATIPAWTVLSTADARAAWQRAVVPAAPVADLFHRIGLATPTLAATLANVVQTLGEIADELVATLKLDAALAQHLLAADQASGDVLAATIALFKAAVLPSVLPLVTSGGEVLLIVSATSLVGGVSLHQRRADIRWFTVPLEADARAGSLDKRIGSRNRFVYAGAGSASQVTALMAIAAGRRGNPDPRRRLDPFTVTVGFAEPAALLDLVQYEYLMNLLERLHAIGVTVNTSAIRASHIDPDHHGGPTPLGQRISRTFRPFRMRRHATDARLIENA